MLDAEESLFTSPSELSGDKPAPRGLGLLCSAHTEVMPMSTTHIQGQGSLYLQLFYPTPLSRKKDLNSNKRCSRDDLFPFQFMKAVHLLERAL